MSYEFSRWETVSVVFRIGLWSSLTYEIARQSRGGIFAEKKIYEDYFSAPASMGGGEIARKVI